MAKTQRRRRRRSKWHCFLLVVAFIVAGNSVMVIQTATAPPASAAGIGLLDKCDFIPDPGVATFCKIGKGLNGGKPITGVPTPGKILNQVAGSAIDSALQDFTKAEAKAVSAVLGKMMSAINNHTVPSINAEWFAAQYAILFGMAVFLALGLGLARAATGIKNQDAGEVVSAFGGILGFLLLGGLIPLIVDGAVHVLDGTVTGGFLDLISQSLKNSLVDMEHNLTDVNVVDAVLIPMLILLVGVVMGIVTLLELYLREGALFVFTAAEIFGLALYVGGRWTKSAFNRISFGLGGLISLKLVMAIILSLGIGLLGSGSGGSDPVILGSITCLMVPVLSYGYYKLVTKHDPQVKKAYQGAKRAATKVAALVAAG